jgi:nitroimidazol reductase NimA-like FMN-containing flavoprotein (pyridoxamine 5'-phosphate oxidase superfamily)
MTSKPSCVHLESMDEAACVRKLAAHGVGRLSVIVDDAPMIVPVNYAWLDGGIVFATDVGTKANALTLGVAAFEIDDIDRWNHTGWSVLVVGRAAVGVEIDGDLVAVSPWCGTSATTRWVRIEPERISGRRIVRTAAD